MTSSLGKLPSENLQLGFLGRWQRICLQSRRPRFHPQVRKIPWSRKCQPTLVFFPGEFHGQRSLAGHSPWGCKKLDTTDRLMLSFTLKFIGKKGQFLHKYLNVVLSPTSILPRKRKQQPTPVFLPGESHGQRSLAGDSPSVAGVRHDLATKLPTTSILPTLY